jgi:hypothetical protein
MIKRLFILFLFVSVVFAEYNDTVMNYIFENRNVLQKYFQEKEYDWLRFLRGTYYERGIPYEEENFWQKESLFTTNANIKAYYKHKDEIIKSIYKNRELCKEPIFFNIVLPLIKEGEFSVNALSGIPSEILIRNKEKIKELLNYLIDNSSSPHWKNAKSNNSIRDIKISDNNTKSGYTKGYAGYATLAKLDSVYNYKIVSTKNTNEREMFSIICKDVDGFQKRDTLMRASRYLQIVDSCSNGKLKKKALNYIEQVTDSGIVHYVNKSYSKDKIIENFIKDPLNSRVTSISYIKYLGDTAILSAIAPYLCNIRDEDKNKDVKFAYSAPIRELLGSFYYDFNFDNQKYYFSVFNGYNVLEMFYRPRYHNNRLLSEMYSESYMDYMNKYEAWIKKKFGKELRRKPQPDDIYDTNRGSH